MRRLDDVERDRLKTELRTRWERLPALRQEFGGNFNAYYQYKLASAQGLTNCLGREATDGTAEFLEDAGAIEVRKQQEAQAARLRASTLAAERRRFATDPANDGTGRKYAPFCPECGVPVPTPEPEDGTCPECGSPLAPASPKSVEPGQMRRVRGR